MKRQSGPFRVYVGLVPTGYLDSNLISQKIKEGVAFCKIPDSKQILLYTEGEATHSIHSRHAYCHPKVVQATKAEVLRLAPKSRITLLEAKSIHKTKQIRYYLFKGSSNEMITADVFYDSDFKVYCPKLKGNILTHGFSGALALGGSHENTICELLEISCPQLVVSDGIIVPFGGHHLNQMGHELGVILVSNNPVAHDLVATKILNLNPAQILHLKYAIEQGWGPQQINQIEIGGDETQAINQLSQKTRHWDFGFIRIEDFQENFERENQNLQFPFEILSGPPYETSGAHGLLLDWLYWDYASPNRRAKMARWPKATLCVGKVFKYPKHKVVYTIGDQACTSFQTLQSSSKTFLQLGKQLSFSWVKLKNNKKHFAIAVKDSPQLSHHLSLAFFLGSLGRMALNRFHFKIQIPRSKKAVSRSVFVNQINQWWGYPPFRNNKASHEIESSPTAPSG